MGAWRCGSDENDQTYDTVYDLSINDRTHVVTEKHSGERVMVGSWYFRDVGVVVWLIKQGALVPLPALRETIEQLLSEKEEGSELRSMWGDNTNKRLAEIDKEVALLNRAIEAGGMTDATGSKTLMTVIAESSVNADGTTGGGSLQASKTSSSSKAKASSAAITSFFKPTERKATKKTPAAPPPPG